MSMYIFIALAIALALFGIVYICVGKNRLGSVLLVVAIIIVKLICETFV